MEREDIFWFNEIGQEASELVGKKCANLGEMTKLKMPVPNGFAISIRAHERFMEETDALQEIRELLNKAGELKDINLQAEVSEKIRHIIEGKEIPSALHDAIESYYEQLCRKCAQKDIAVSVRSAGAKSHPGQYETYLNIRGKQQVLEKVKKVWASIFNTRTVAAMVQQGLPVDQSPCIGVGTVEMVNARSAGVCFTVHPVTGDPSKAVIEANWGLGESVVSGIISTDMYVLDKESLKVIDKSWTEKKVYIVPRGDGVVEEEVPSEKQNIYTLNDEEAAEIVRLGKALELHFNQPQDLEWAIDADRTFPHNIYLLQTRPVVGVKIQKPKTADEQILDDLVKKLF
jgi:pyruvate,water dikinase